MEVKRVSHGSAAPSGRSSTTPSTSDVTEQKRYAVYALVALRNSSTSRVAGPVVHRDTTEKARS